MRARNQHIGVQPYAPGYRGFDERLLTVRDVALRLKEPDPVAVEAAAAEMVKFVPQESVLVPVPNSRGDLHPNYVLATSIAALAQAEGKRAHVAELVCRKRPQASSYSLRRRGLTPLSAEQHAMVLCPGVTELPQAPIVLVDNVMVSGATFDASRQALGGRGNGLAYAYALRRAERPVFALMAQSNGTWQRVRAFLRALFV
jgi:predicted amidophosphoribosyltransferase